MPAETNQRKRLSEQVADEIQSDILREGLTAGRKLPTEVQLMERFNVSRTVLREAVHTLVQRGLVTVTPGRGTEVAEFDGSIVAEQFALQMEASQGSFPQLLELRFAIDVQVSTSAALNVTEAQIAELGACIDAGKRLITPDGVRDRLAFLDQDVRFHEILAKASGNPYLELVSQPINHFLRKYYSTREGYPSNPGRTVEEHETILRAISQADTLAARQAIEHHLMRLLRRWSPVTPADQTDE
ncbi:FadR/GntR family transcriptional regulator [Citricoccus sp. K5]|uniref:FadR/GntR family transcriptional regulator n=1 Tax=Citricoccus sp. K5 TaxID=2653135 RepID=UPI0012F32004|nr:FadR/GntR family transcriptional regulator [Citricoccus sp. K5]VXB65596.1 DNA-binding transcriptional regulator, FadR family [Citricoccus sp. K5]